MDRAFRLVETLDWEADLPQEAWRARVELYQSLTNLAWFHCRCGYQGLACLRSENTLLQAENYLCGEHDLTSFYLVDCTADFAASLDSFPAPSIAEALAVVMRALGIHLQPAEESPALRSDCTASAPDRR